MLHPCQAPLALVTAVRMRCSPGPLPPETRDPLWYPEAQPVSYLIEARDVPDGEWSELERRTVDPEAPHLFPGSTLNAVGELERVDFTELTGVAGLVLEYHYEGGRLVRIDAPADSIELEYRADLRVLERTRDGLQKLHFVYEGDRLIKTRSEEGTGEGFDIASYSYTDGKLTRQEQRSRGLANPEFCTYTWQGNRLLGAVCDPGDGPSHQAVRYTFDY